MRRVFFLLLTAVLLWGCPSAPKEPSPFLLKLSPGNAEPAQFYERFVALDKQASEALYYVSHKQQRLPSGQIRILVNLQNADPQNDTWVDWKVVFYDGSDFKIEETEWKAEHFPIREIKTIKAQSIRRDAEKYTFMLRTLKD